MRSILSAPLIATVTAQKGESPIIFLDIYWKGLAYPPYKYADQDLDHTSYGDPSTRGKILQLSGLSSIVKLGNQSTTGSLTIELDDTDDEIKILLKERDLQKVPVAVFLGYASLATDIRLHLFTGQVSSPINWGEGNRTLRFDIVSAVENREVGFSPEQGFFKNLDPAVIGRSWPMVFGKVINVPAPLITARIKGISYTKYSIITHKEVEQLQTFIENYHKIKQTYDTIQTNGGDYAESEIIKIMTEYSDTRIKYQEYLTQLSNYSNRDELIQALANSYILYLDNRQDIYEKESEISQMEADLVTYETYRTGLITRKELIQSMISSYPHLGSIYADELSRIDGQISYYTTVITTLNTNLPIARGELITLQVERTELYNIYRENRKEILSFSLDEIKVQNGAAFPQNQNIQIRINDLLLTGKMNGETFTVAEKQMPTYRHVKFGARINDYPNEFTIKNSSIDLRRKFCFIRADVGDPVKYRVIYVTDQVGTRCIFKPIVYKRTGDKKFDPVLFAEPGENDETTTDEILEVSPLFLKTWYNYLLEDEFKPYETGLTADNLGEDWAMDIGDEIYYEDPDYEHVYIANILPSNSVKQVMAYRRVNGKRKLMPVPSSYYTVDLDYEMGDLNVTRVVLKKPLKDYSDEDWDDQIYVTLHSTEGPNTADIIKFIILNYSSYSYDTTSFATVASYLTNYPSNFYLDRRQNVLQLIEDIAWQARCAVWLRNDVVYIKYLSLDTGAVGTLTKNDIIVDTMRVDYTETDQIVTKLVARWKKDNAVADPYSLILRNNTGKYGVQEAEYNFYIYNDEALVRKSATFWLIRYSNTWKRLTCQTPLHKIQFESYDVISLQFGLNEYVATGNVNALVEDVVYDSQNQVLNMSFWVPVRSGDMEQYDFAYPSQVSTELQYPTSRDPYAGGYTDGDVVNSGGRYDYDTKPWDIGDLNPSDLGDVEPVDPIANVEPVDYKPTKVPVVANDPVVQIDINNTVVKDYSTGLSSVLADIIAFTPKYYFQADIVGQLALKTTALYFGFDLVDQVPKVAPMGLRYFNDQWKAFNPVMGDLTE